ncbi:hypothetical protein PR048_033677 [Dryococelus australis]|uniref:Uncharacterized protein n=1 Tax=Dryococelus australis TaxID=614101 RepID=A0ABQ9G0Y8_9NEOP|nr:hypothetical protein PR048_033677 [Dryococelus australis]
MFSLTLCGEEMFCISRRASLYSCHFARPCLKSTCMHFVYYSALYKNNIVVGLITLFVRRSIHRENPPTNGIVRHDSHMRKSGMTRPGIELGLPWREESRLTDQLPRPLFKRADVAPSSFPGWNGVIVALWWNWYINNSADNLSNVKRQSSIVHTTQLYRMHVSVDDETVDPCYIQHSTEDSHWPSPGTSSYRVTGTFLIESVNSAFGTVAKSDNVWFPRISLVSELWCMLENNRIHLLRFGACDNKRCLFRHIVARKTSRPVPSFANSEVTSPCPDVDAPLTCESRYSGPADLLIPDPVCHTIPACSQVKARIGKIRRLDSTVLCILESQMFAHWLLLQRVASVLTWQYGTRYLFPCKPTIGSESSRACLVVCDPIAKLTSNHPHKRTYETLKETSKAVRGFVEHKQFVEMSGVQLQRPGDLVSRGDVSARTAIPITHIVGFPRLRLLSVIPRTWSLNKESNKLKIDIVCTDIDVPRQSGVASGNGSNTEDISKRRASAGDSTYPGLKGADYLWNSYAPVSHKNDTGDTQTRA